MIGPAFLMDEDLVVVSINYRLGPYGFAYTGDGLIQGNMGLKDQVLALRWVSENIEAFGGNKSSVTLFGTSAGSISGTMHIMSRQSTGLFHRVFGTSGTAFNGECMPNPIKQLSEGVNCSIESSEAMVACLKNANPHKIISVNVRKYYNWPVATFAPVVEVPRPNQPPSEMFLPRSFQQLFEDGQINAVPTVLGMMEVEAYRDANEAIAYPAMLQEFNTNWNAVAPYLFYLNVKGNNGFLQNAISQYLRHYYFGCKNVSSDTVLKLANLWSDREFANGIWRTALLNAMHAPTWTYILKYRRDPDIPTQHTSDIDLLYSDNGLRPAPQPGSVHEQISKRYVHMLANFAKTGTVVETDPNWLPVNPNNDGNVDWYGYDLRSQMISEGAEKNSFTKRMRFWEDMRKVLSQTECGR